jgi:hypothetical protein
MRKSLRSSESLSGSFKGPLTGSYEQSNESRDFLNDAAFLYQMSNYYLHKKISARWSWLFSVFTVLPYKHLRHFKAMVTKTKSFSFGIT